ncbi:MAG: ABC transporter substrate-binding protein, partial [Polyangiaceae bacterium]|nr:ABC transporter substrate-binding protein [Polyangiaceae bacterium]
MKLTPLAKGFIATTVVGVVGFVVWKNVGEKAKEWSGANPAGSSSAQVAVSKDDFSGLGPGQDHDRKNANPAVSATDVGKGRLNRPLRVAINTWAGHAPGIVANGGLEAKKSGSIYVDKYNVQVEFELIEDPAAKLAAFSAGKIDVMWDTVDSWSREASTLAEQKIKGKAILQEDWSRGGDGIVSTKGIKSIEDLKGKKVATTQYTPSHWLFLYMLHQSGLTGEDKRALESNLIFTTDAPSAAAAFRSKKVDAAVTWEPDLSGAVKAREAEAHILVSTTSATNVIADTLVARQDIVDQSPETLRDFVHGWLDGIDAMGKDPSGTNELVAKALKLTADDVSGMLSGLKLTHFGDNALFFGLGGAKSQAMSLFDTAFIVWRKQGAINKVVEAKDNFDPRFVSALGSLYAGQKVEETFKADPK